jgi:hypothetical protein
MADEWLDTWTVFWAPKDTRVGATVNLLLAVSALYIVVFQNIPMVSITSILRLSSVADVMMIMIAWLLDNL